MLAILDPRIFEAQPRLEDVLRQTVEVLIRSGAMIPEIDPYWTALERAFSPLRQYNRHLDAIRRFRGRVALKGAPGTADIRGLDQILDGAQAEWTSILRHLIAASAATDRTILVTRLIEGRNLKLHFDENGREALREKTLWSLQAELGRKLVDIPLVCIPRNFQIPWTARFDDALPATEDGAAFPFCPPAGWRNETTRVWGTSKARCCWFDQGSKRSWANPRTPGETRHWDVYLETTDLREAYGLNYLNIVRFGGPPEEGRPGELHHVAAKLQGALKKTTGWQC